MVAGSRDSRPTVFVAAVVSLFVIGCAARSPQLIIHPRLWAEEATVYLARALSYPWPTALSMPDNGYLAFVSNAAGIGAAHLVPLEYAPIVTLGISLLFMMLPLVVILTAPGGLFARRSIQLLSAPLLLLIVPNQEVWLNTITSQFFLALTAGIILALPAAPSFRLFRRGVLLLAGIGGAVTSFLLPLFIFRAWLDRSRERVIQTALLAMGTVVQVAVVLTAGLGAREIRFDPILSLFALMVKSVALPLVGPQTAAELATRLRALHTAGGPAALITAMLIFFGVAVGMTLLFRTGSPEVRWLLAGAAVLLLFSTMTSVDGPRIISLVIGGRYAFAPNALWTLALLLSAVDNHASFYRRAVCIVLLVLTVRIGIQEYRKPHTLFFSGPNWRAEVASWRANPDHALRIWPRPWTLRLP